MKTPDLQLRQQLDAKLEKYSDAMNKNDAAALASFFTEEAVLATDMGPIHGREAIEKHFADNFQKDHCSNHIVKADQYSPHVVGTTGNEMWSNGEWSITLQGQDWGPKEFKGYWTEIYVREGNAWKVRMQMWNLTPAPPA